MKKALKIGLVTIFGATSIGSGFLISNKIEKDKLEVKTLEQNENNIKKQLKIKELKYQKISDYLFEKSELLKALDVKEFNEKVISKINQTKLKNILVPLVNKAISYSDSYLQNNNKENHGKVFWKINQIDFSVDVIVVWKNISFDKINYYDSFKINYLF